MTSTTFSSGTVVASSWLNDVNNITYGQLSQKVPLSKYISATALANIALGSAVSAAEVTAGIITAYTDCASKGLTLELPAGIIYVTPSSPLLDETGGNNLATFPMVNNMYIVGQIGTVLKITNNVSTDASPKLMSMFFSNSVLSNIYLENITFDMNGTNNKISPLRPSSYNLFTQAAILFSGTPAGIAARGENVTVKNCTFLNTAGVTCIGMSQTNSSGVTLGKNWRILNCTFKNNGLDSNDHSSIYAWADNVLIDGCTFDADIMYGTVGDTGGLVCIEVHGANQRISNCFLRNYYQGVWLASNKSTPAEYITIVGNNFGPLCGIGVAVYRESALESEIKQVNITGNTFYLTDDVRLVTLKAAVIITPTYTVSDILISNNIAYKVGTSQGSTFAATGPQFVAGQKFNRISITNNQAYGFTFGVAISTNATNGFGNLVIKNNQFYNLVPAGAFSVPIGISGSNIDAAGPVDFLEIDGNTISGTSIQYGIYLSGAVTNLATNNNFYSGISIANWYEVSFTATNRQGVFNNISFTPMWNAGSAITVGNGSVQGNYSLYGDIVTYNSRLTVGSTTSFPGGTLSVSLPFASTVSNTQYLGNFRIFDASAGLFYTGISEVDGTASVATLQLNAGGNTSNTSPITLATGDIVSVQITYRK